MTLPEGTNSLSWLPKLCWPYNQMQSPSCALIKTESSVSNDKLIGNWERLQENVEQNTSLVVSWMYSGMMLQRSWLSALMLANCRRKPRRILNLVPSLRLTDKHINPPPFRLIVPEKSALKMRSSLRIKATPIPTLFADVALSIP